MNWQDDPEIQREMQRGQVRGRLLRSTLIWGPPFLACAAAFVFFTFDRLFLGPDYGSTWFLVVVLAIFTGLFGFQAVQSFLDYIGQPVSESGVVTRRWARSDSFVIKTHYIRLGKHILRGDQLILDGIREGDYVEATFYPHSAVLVWVDKRPAPDAVEEAPAASDRGGTSYTAQTLQSRAMAESEARAYRTIRDWAGDERPRERLLEHGAETLSDAELLAIILRSGLAGENVVDMARGLIDTFGGMDGLLRAGPKALQRAKGLGPAKAAQVAAAIELGRRAQSLSPSERPDLRTPERVYALLGPSLVASRREQLFCLALDTRGRLLGGLNPVVSGSANAISLRPAELFREAIILDAPSVILVHNHPSGDPRPSPQDIATTKAFIAAGKILDLSVEDHVVIGTNSWVSMKREKMAFS